MLQPETIYSSDSFKRAKNKFLSRATAIVVIGPRQIGNQPNAHLTYMLQINTILLLRHYDNVPGVQSYDVGIT